MTLQRKATLVASFTATLLATIKLVIGILSGSVAVLASAIDSLLDLVVSIFNFFALTKAEQPADEQFNYGKGKIEALASVIEGTIITVSGLYIFYESVKKAYTGESTGYLDTAIWVMLFSILVTTVLVTFLHFVAKKTASLVIKSDALHYKTDLISNGVILLSLGAIYFTGIHLIDAIMGILIALYIIYSAYGLIKDGVFVLLDASLDDELVNGIKHAVSSEKDVTDYHWLKTRHASSTNFVDMHLVFTPDISLLNAHRAADRIEASIKELDINCDWIINLHLDPYDDSEVNKPQEQNGDHGGKKS